MTKAKHDEYGDIRQAFYEVLPLLERTASPHATAFVRDAVDRMQAAPRFFSQDEWNALASTYDGPVVSGDPEGRIPDNLKADDIE